MLESKSPNLIANIFKKGSTMTDEKTLEKRVKKLEQQIADLQENIDSIGELNNTLTCRHNALAECLAHIIARPDFLKNAPTLFATAVYDLINLAADDQEISETCAKASREEIDAFFSRIQELKKLDQPSRS